MESRALILGACWIAVALISVVYIWVGGVNFSTDIAVGLLIAVAFVLTIVVGFGERGMDLEKETEVSKEVLDMRSKIDEIAVKVDEIKKALEE
jgi:preprotein translocase subunit SecF